LLFVIVAAVTRTAFSAVWGVYVFGLCVTCVFAVALACLGFIRRADKKNAGEGRSAGYVKEMTENQNNVQFVEGAQSDGGQPVINTAAQPQTPPYAQQPYQAPPQQPAPPQGQPYQGQPYPGQTYAQPYQNPQYPAGGGYNQPYPQAQPYAQPYQPQQPQQPAQTDYNRDYNRDFGRGFGGNASGETTIDGKPGFFSYNVDREQPKPEYTGGDPGFLSYYPERDAENPRRTAAFDDGAETENADFARRDRDFTRDNDFSRSDRGDFGRDNDFARGDTNRGDFGRSETRGFDGSTDGFARGRNEESAATPFPTAVPEKPAIFRTRMDPNMLIYEYSDRLEFYKITAQGPVRVSVEYKNPGGNR